MTLKNMSNGSLSAAARVTGDNAASRADPQHKPVIHHTYH